MAESHDVVVVGAGAIGLCTAYYLIQEGFNVEIHDKRGEDFLNCSYGNAGMIVPSHFAPLASPSMLKLGMKYMFSRSSPFGIQFSARRDFWRWMMLFMRKANDSHVKFCELPLIQLNLASKELFNDLHTVSQGQFELLEKSLLMICKHETIPVDDPEIVAAKKHGLAARAISEQQFKEIEPNATITAEGGIQFGCDSHINSTQFMHWMKQHLLQAGCHFIYNSKLNLAAEKRTLVLCAGAESGMEASKLGLRLPILSGKGYSVDLHNPPEQFAACSILDGARVAVSPYKETIRFSGTMEMGAQLGAVNSTRLNRMFESIQEFFPKFTPDLFANLPVWEGLRPCSPDGLPYIGKSRLRENLYVATGHSMMGMSLAPITGKIIANSLTQKEQPMDIEPFSTDRFHR